MKIVLDTDILISSTKPSKGTLADAERISALRKIKHLQNEAKKGRRADFDTFLAAVPDIEPDPEDML